MNAQLTGEPPERRAQCASSVLVLVHLREQFTNLINRHTLPPNVGLLVHLILERLGHDVDVL